MDAIRIILASIRNADNRYNLISKGDKILVGVSGGKDSLVLAYALYLYKKFSKCDFEIQPVIMDLGFPGFDAAPLSKYFKKLGMNLIVNDSTFVYEALKANQKNKSHLPCSICSRMKKAAMNTIARDLGFNKVAFAHHVDDAVETLFMNVFYAGKIASFEPKMHLNRSDIDFIRPLCLAKEEDIARCAIEENLPIMPSHCPADKSTKREDIKKYLSDIYLKGNNAKENVYTAIINDSQNKLWDKSTEYKIEGTNLSLRPVITSTDAFTAINIRYRVFVDSDLKIKFEEEMDGSDLDGKHIGYIIKKDKTPIGFIRVEIINSHEIRIGRVAMLEEYRHNGYMKLALSKIIEMYSREINPLLIKLHSIKKVAPLYEQLGFTVCGDEDIECRIPHLPMKLYINR